MAIPRKHRLWVRRQKSWDLLNHIEHRLEPTPPLVAVVDSGFNLNDDLEAVESVHLLGEPSARVHEESHGTQIAGVIGATKNNQTGVVGVAADHSRLALFDYGTPILFRALQAISQAADSDATIINMSWSSAWPLFQKQHGPQALNEWFAELADTALLVAASGNEGIDLDSGPSQLPCGASAVLCVGGLDSFKELSQYSNYGSDEHASDVDLYAPFQVFGFARPNDDRPSAGEVSGTSISAAFVSGIAAMVKHAGPHLSPAEIKDILIRHSDRLADQPTINIGHAFKSVHSVVGETIPLLFIDELDDDQQNQIRLHQPFQLNASSLDFDSEQPVRIDWYSSLDGFLGSGHHIEAIVRQFGEHAIIAVATDADEMIEAKTHGHHCQRHTSKHRYPVPDR